MQHREKSRGEPWASSFCIICRARSICEGSGARIQATTPIVKNLYRRDLRGGPSRSSPQAV
eukprot:4433318-Pyramimonas_sp.AAC.1